MLVLAGFENCFKRTKGADGQSEFNRHSSALWKPIDKMLVTTVINS
jgi:hypothetical protein